MKAVVLANMGAPYSEKQMKTFLKRMFSDKAIIYAPTWVRRLVSFLISNIRYKSSWRKYDLIGGSPLYASMDETAISLQAILPDDYRVFCAYSYSEPFMPGVYRQLYQSGIYDVTVIPMYPQASYSTTGSLKTDTAIAAQKYPQLNIRFIDDYFEHPLFIAFWVKQISNKIKAEGYHKPYLLFSAHAIPQSFIQRGDTYALQMERSAELIAASLGLPYSVAYQSKIGPVGWTKPYTIEQLKALKTSGIDQIVVVPLSFINENLETRYDIDTEIIPQSRNAIGIQQICRVTIPQSDEMLVNMFAEFVNKEQLA
jgi:ferrochelatase